MSADYGINELCQHVRDRLPLRARLVGRERLCDVVMMAITEWPIDDLLACGRGSAEEEKCLDRIRSSVGRTYEAVHGHEKNYGFIWSFVLSAAVSAIIQVILKWWLDKRANRMRMAIWQHSMREAP